MPEVTASAPVNRPVSEVWAFIAEMDNWAPMLKGYEKHEKKSDTESVWTLNGDLGPFSKSVDMNVQVVEWLDSERIAFTLEGITEVFTGSGSLELGSEAAPRSAWQRFWDWLLRREAPRGDLFATFNFQIDAGGPMGPMVNPMLGPYAKRVAEDLVTSVAAHLLAKPGMAESRGDS